MNKVGKTTRPLRYDLNQIPYNYTVEMMNKFEGLDLVDRVPEKLWTEVHNIVQEAATKITLKKKKSKKAKWLSEEALQIAEEREAKSKGERERYIQLNAEFQRIARRDKKAFFNEESVKLEENRRGKTRDLFRKIGDIKGTFHSRMGTIKDRGSKDQQKQKRFRRSGKNTQKTNTKKILMTQITTMV